VAEPEESEVIEATDIIEDPETGKEVVDLNTDPLRVAKMFLQKDIKMDQSAQILQAILGKNFGKNGSSKDTQVQLFSTGQIINVNGEGCELPHTALQKLLIKLPQPRMENLMKMVHDVAFFMHGGDGIKASQFLGLDSEGPAAVEGNSGVFHGSMLEISERTSVLKALESGQWRQKKAAEILGISPRALNYKVKKFGITHEAWRKNAPEKKGGFSFAEIEEDEAIPDEG